MAARKKNQTPAEQTDELEQTGQEPEQNTRETGQTGQEPEQDTGETERDDGKEDKPGPKPERDEFDNIPNPCVYCGPSVRGVARQYTTYQGGLPEELKRFVREHPAARRLIVSTARFAAVRKRLETNGTAEAAVYKKVKAEL